METNHREILILYNPDSAKDRKTVAHAKGLSPYIRLYSFEKAQAMGTGWPQILSALALHPRELLDKSHPYYQQNIRGRELDAQAWLDVLKYNPSLLKAPIAIRGDKAVLCSRATDIYCLMNGEPVTIF